MTQPVNISNPVYAKLKIYRDRGKYKSFTAVIEDMLRLNWNPEMTKLQIHEAFNDLVGFLRTRALLDDGIEEMIERLRGRVLLRNKQFPPLEGLKD